MPRLVRAANELRYRRGHSPIKIRVTAHTMRHAYVALLAHGSSPRVYTQTQVGHDDPTTADWAYNYVFEQECREQVGAGLARILERGRQRLDSSRPAFLPRPAEQPFVAYTDSSQLALW